VGEAERASQSLFNTSEIRTLYLEGLSSLSFLFRHYHGETATEHPIVHIQDYYRNIACYIQKCKFVVVTPFLLTPHFHCALSPIEIIITVHYYYYYYYYYYFILLGVGPVAQSVLRLSYGLDGPGSNSGGGEIFRPSRPGVGSTQPPVQWIPGFSRG